MDLGSDKFGKEPTLRSRIFQSSLEKSKTLTPRPDVVLKHLTAQFNSYANQDLVDVNVRGFRNTHTAIKT